MSQESLFVTARHVQLCRTPCVPIAPIGTLPIEPFVYLVSVLLDLGMSVSCSYHVITSSLLWGRPEEVGHKKSNLGAGQGKLAGSFVMTHRR